MTSITKDNWTLYPKHSTDPIKVGEKLPDFNGIEHIIQGGTPPHKPSSTGRIYTNHGEFFPTVLGLHWVQRRRSLVSGCQYCENLKASGSNFHPPHDASPRCESGGRPHCTCDTCF
jgi:hypothetical protein